MALQDAVTGSTVIPVIRLPAGTGLPEWVKNYLEPTVTDPVAGVTNVPDADTLYNLVMADPEIIGSFLSELEKKDLKDWPDQVMLSGWVQARENEAETPPFLLQTAITGPRRRRQTVTVPVAQKEATFYEYVETRFVLVCNPDLGYIALERWDNNRHGKGKNTFEDLPNTFMTPAKILKYATEEPNLWGVLSAFANERKKKGGASHRVQPQKTRLKPKVTRKSG